jgi:hypothetical protein
MRVWNISSDPRISSRCRESALPGILSFDTSQRTHLTVHWHALTKLNTATKNLATGSVEQFNTEYAMGDWTHPTGFPWARNLTTTSRPRMPRIL